MTRSRKATEPDQVTIDDFDLGVDHIAGGAIPDQELFREVRDQTMRAIHRVKHGSTPACIPDQRIHVYAGDGPCQCKEHK